MRKQRIVSLAVAVALLAIMAPGSLAMSTEPLPPGMEAFSKSALSGSEIQFSREDFVSHVGGGLSLEGIVLAEMPEEGTGELRCGSRTMMSGEAIIASALDELRFVPVTNKDVSTQFTFLPVFGGEVGRETVAVALNLTGRDNRPPLAESMTLTTYKNIALTEPFRGSDPDGDQLTYKVTSKPKRGAVEVMPEGNFCYTPYQNKTGKDSFSYVATDSFGNASPEAMVELKIEKPGTKMTYADMEGNPAYYAALKLSEANVFVGEKVGNQYYFNPDLPVSRGEFVTMVMAMVGEKDVSAVARTGFSDDDVTPVWVKPYATAAVKAGIIRGVGLSDGRKELRANQDIDRAQAAVILNNALKMADTSEAVFADWNAVPVWAQQAAINMEAVGVMSVFYDGTMRLDESINRAQAAQMLLTAMEVKDKNEPKKGLLSWVFG